MIKIARISGKGRGLVASAAIPKGTIVESSPLVIFNKKDSVILEKTKVGSYCFAYSPTRICIALGLGSLFNHSSEPNVEAVTYYGERDVLHFETIRDIAEGEELVINYGWDEKDIDFIKKM